ncbi:hypothetical protein D0U04_26515 [Bacillus clarus]|uniref:Uncharacterized protein n=1 Tax=Bacillus clarus TaxID=2338372 RepID=A0A090YT19_9BACI|nr:hypothetical protein DJ93_5657 [Bacillus clarus]RFT62964.1 hypothetical protein D0U04_26515 [Bacillus clarus]
MNPLNVSSIKILLAHSWQGNTAKEIERRLSEVDKELVYRIDEFKRIEVDLEKYRKAVEGECIMMKLFTKLKDVLVISTHRVGIFFIKKRHSNECLFLTSK